MVVVHAPERRGPRREDVLAALRPEGVLGHFGIQARTSGDEIRLRVCPACGPRNRDCVCVHRITGRWFDHARGCKGDIFDMVARLAGLDCGSDFPSVLDLAAQIAGVDVLATASTSTRPPDPDPFINNGVGKASSGAPPVRAPASATSSDFAMAEASRLAIAVWTRLHESSEAGAAYLTRRGLAALAGSTHVRYAPLAVEPLTTWGKRVGRLLSRAAICVPVHAVDSGSIINVVARRLDVRSSNEPKVVSLPAMKKVVEGRLLGTFGSWAGYVDHPRDVVIVEGVFDYLSALHLWHDKLVLGADGAQLLPKIGQLVGPQLADSKHRVFLVPHDDPSGLDGNKKLCRSLLAAGVSREQVCVVDLTRHKDLNDAHVAGEVPDVG